MFIFVSRGSSFTSSNTSLSLWTFVESRWSWLPCLLSMSRLPLAWASFPPSIYTKESKRSLAKVVFLTVASLSPDVLCWSLSIITLPSLSFWQCTSEKKRGRKTLISPNFLHVNVIPYLFFVKLVCPTSPTILRLLSPRQSPTPPNPTHPTPAPSSPPTLIFTQTLV